jgi:hypothetical protein
MGYGPAKQYDIPDRPHLCSLCGRVRPAEDLAVAHG